MFQSLTSGETVFVWKSWHLEAGEQYVF